MKPQRKTNSLKFDLLDVFLGFIIGIYLTFGVYGIITPKYTLTTFKTSAYQDKLKFSTPSWLTVEPDLSLSIKSENILNSPLAVPKIAMTANYVISKLFVVLIFALLYKIFYSMRKNQVFEERNLNRVRYIGFAYILLFVFSIVSNFVIANSLNGFITLNEQTIDSATRFLGYNGGRIIGQYAHYLVTGIVVLAISKIFGRAIKMKQETELTI